VLPPTPLQRLLFSTTAQGQVIDTSDALADALFRVPHLGLLGTSDLDPARTKLVVQCAAKHIDQVRIDATRAFADLLVSHAYPPIDDAALASLLDVRIDPDADLPWLV
jgi:hypothetical protein